MAAEIPGLNKLKGMGNTIKDIANRIDSAHKATDKWLKAAEKNAEDAIIKGIRNLLRDFDNTIPEKYIRDGMYRDNVEAFNRGFCIGLMKAAKEAGQMIA